MGTLENGAPYMVMEYLEGGDLAAWLKQRGALPIEQAVEFVLQACVAVADAHALGIVHRDLKPANLFCVRRSDGQLSIKVLDFGISKMTDTSGSARSMTHAYAMMGSPLYMSPEQMRSAKDVDAQTDIWSLGVILFELMTGRPAFMAGSLTELAIKVNNEAAPDLDRWVLVAAHYDHLGRAGGHTYRGADDNAAAVAILVDVANSIARTRPQGRGILFAAFDAEEPPYFLSDSMGSEYLRWGRASRARARADRTATSGRHRDGGRSYVGGTPT